MNARLQQFAQRLPVYAELMRLDRPIGILLLLWPTLWALWIAGGGQPGLDTVLIFTLGVILMRSAGCVINDFADRNLDGHVERTQGRPLATGRASAREALVLFLLLCTFAFGLVLLTNRLTVMLSLGAVALAALYPFMKRYTYLPQVFLGAAFSWAIPMAFAAETGAIATEAWILYVANLLWTVAYDTEYAMVDREDDLQVGIKSTAILFGDADRVMIGILQALTLFSLVLLGIRVELGAMYYLGLGGAGLLFAYQVYSIRERDRPSCFEAFLSNNRVGAVIFFGVALDYLIRQV